MHIIREPSGFSIGLNVRAMWLIPFPLQRGLDDSLETFSAWTTLRTNETGSRAYTSLILNRLSSHVFWYIHIYLTLRDVENCNFFVQSFFVCDYRVIGGHPNWTTLSSAIHEVVSAVHKYETSAPSFSVEKFTDAGNRRPVNKNSPDRVHLAPPDHENQGAPRTARPGRPYHHGCWEKHVQLSFSVRWTQARSNVQTVAGTIWVPNRSNIPCPQYLVCQIANLNYRWTWIPHIWNKRTNRVGVKSRPILWVKHWKSTITCKTRIVNTTDRRLNPPCRHYP